MLIGSVGKEGGEKAESSFALRLSAANSLLLTRESLNRIGGGPQDMEGTLV